MSQLLRHELSWRLKRRLLRRAGLYWFKANDLRLLIEWPTGLARQIYYNEVYHPETVAYLKENLSPSDICVDVGANIGYLTIIMAQKASLVIAFEPDPQLREIMRRNLKANNINNVIVRHEAVSDIDGRARFFLNREPLYSGLIGHTGVRDIIEVDTITLDSILHEPQAPTFVKIDVEGAEAQVLRGMKNLLLNSNLRLIVEIEPERRGFSDDLYTILDGWQFRNLDELNVLCWRNGHV